VDKIAGLDLYPGPFILQYFFVLLSKLSVKKITSTIGKIKSIIKGIFMNDRGKKADSSELEKSKSHIIVEIIEYMANSVVIKTIIKKSTGNISIMSFDSGEGLTEKTSPFDTFVQIIEGKAEIVIDRICHVLEAGQGIIIPAHLSNFIKPNGRFKMISTIIKSGYE
jgi:quercetin dioxygenase-like cupin family protein